MADQSNNRALTIVIVLSLLVPALGVGGILYFSRRSTEGRAAEAECPVRLRELASESRRLVREGGYVPDAGAFPRVFALRLDEQALRYTYFLAPGVARAGTPPIGEQELPGLLGGLPPGVAGICPACEVVAACAADLDADPTLDVWSVATFDRPLPDGGVVDAGEPYHDVHDR